MSSLVSNDRWSAPVISGNGQLIMMMPAIFFGHGNPMNALAKNVFTQG